MTNCYVVTQGSYSDYQIRRVFADADLACAFANEYGGKVEVWPLTENWTPGDMPWKVTIWDDGDIRAKVISHDDWGFTDVFRPVFCPKWTEAYVEAKTEAEAIEKAQAKLEEHRVEA